MFYQRIEIEEPTFIAVLWLQAYEEDCPPAIATSDCKVEGMNGEIGTVLHAPRNARGSKCSSIC